MRIVFDPSNGGNEPSAAGVIEEAESFENVDDSSVIRVLVPETFKKLLDEARRCLCCLYRFQDRNSVLKRGEIRGWEAHERFYSQGPTCIWAVRTCGACVVLLGRRCVYDAEDKMSLRLPKVAVTSMVPPRAST